MRTDTDDARLLENFRENGDAEAFAALIARMGPMVLRVCRTVLYDAHLAEDAFQATFLALYQKAGSIQDPRALRGWLCGTAYRTAARIRRRSLRHAQRERAADVDAIGLEGAETDHDLFLIVREELDRLPEKYRAPLTLCYLEGMTHEEAATALAWASGTVKVRLVRGRRMLRERLDRRKIALTAGLVLLWRREAGAASPDLVASTVAAMADARIEGVAELLPPARPLPAGPGPSRAVRYDWRALCRAVLMVAAALAVAAGAAASMTKAPPPAADEDFEDLPSNLVDVLNRACF